MKFKKSLLMVCLIIFLFTIASVSANEVDDAVNAAEDTGIIAVDDSDSVGNIDEILTESSEEDVMEANPEDDGTFSALQQKINNAEEGTVITLDKNYTYDDGFSKRGIQINKNLTINGNGHTLDGLSKSRIFLVRYGLTDNNYVVLNNIKFVNGNTDLYGGAIFNYGNLTVNNCVFTNNYAKYCGGAINSVGHLNLKNSKFTKNTAGGDGGAVLTFSIDKAVEFFKKAYEDETPEGEMEFIFNAPLNIDLSYGTDYVSKCIFTNNIAKGRGGGAIYGFTHLNINSCTFNSNQANEHGGAVFANKNLVLKNSKFTNNKAPKNGGAVYFRCHEQSGSYVNKTWVPKMKYYSANITNCAFSKNTANKGGAIYGFLNVASDKKRLNVNKCNFTANKASTSGRDVLGGTCSNCIYNYIKLTSKNKTVKKSAKSLTLYVKLTKGKALLKNKKIKFRFRGKNYYARTNSKGIAKVIIKKSVLKKLKAGKKYTVKMSYLKHSIKRTVKVKR